MSDSDLLETQLPSTPATSRSRARPADELPDDLLREATQRLGILARVWAGLFVFGLLLNHGVAPLLDIDMKDLIPWGPTADIVAVISIAVSIWLWRYTRRLTCNPRLALDIALGYEVLAGPGHRRRKPVGADAAAGRPAVVALRPDPDLPHDRPQYAPEDADRLADRGVDGPGRDPGGAPAGARDAERRAHPVELPAELCLRADRGDPVQDHDPAGTPPAARAGAGQLSAGGADRPRRDGGGVAGHASDARAPGRDQADQAGDPGRPRRRRSHRAHRALPPRGARRRPVCSRPTRSGCTISARPGPAPSTS